MGTAKKLPSNIAKRWKENKSKAIKEDEQWKVVEKSNVKLMLDEPASRRAKGDSSDKVVKKKKSKGGKKDCW